MGGEFNTVNGMPSPYLARLYGTTPPLLTGFGIVANHFGFNVTGESNQVVVIEGSTNLANWTALSTNTLGVGPLSFIDPVPAKFSKRFYRARLP
jgi:hypothetical protein